jgi:PTS system mannose-specific IIA component
MNHGQGMIGLVLVTHGHLAKEFQSALEHVVGPQQQIDTICIGPDDDMEQRRQDILNAVEAVNDGNGVVLLTDMFGGTPSNLAISVMDGTSIEVVAGVNLPMLIKLASVRGELKLAEAVDEARKAGQKYISVASQVLSGQG